VSPVAVWTTDDGETDALPSCTVNGVLNLSPCQLTWCSASACRPSCAGAVTTSAGPPVAVSNRQAPARTLVFGLFPTVSIVYGAPYTESGSSWKWFSERPMISVSRSVYGPESSQLVLARNLVPSDGVFGTSR
jgi:hypothetical protein